MLGPRLLDRTDSTQTPCPAPSLRRHILAAVAHSLVERAVADPELVAVAALAGDLRTTPAPGRFGPVRLSTVTNMLDADVNRDLPARVHNP